jgi:hypothetical protein
LKNILKKKIFLIKRKEGMATGKIIVMIGLYSLSKLGMANHKTNTLKKLLMREPRDFGSFAQEDQELWMK